MNEFLCFTLLSLLFLQVSGNVDLNQLSNEELLKLLEDLSKKTDQEHQTIKQVANIRRVQVDIQVIA